MPSKSLAPNRFVAQIVKDPTQPPATLLLRGFLGSAPKSTDVRVYLDAELSRFIDAPQEAVLHIEQIPEHHSLLGGQMVWLDRKAPLRRGQVGEGAASFLEGGLAAFPTPTPTHRKEASRRPYEGLTDACNPPPTEDASCATTLQQSTCVPSTQPGECYAPEFPDPWSGRAMISAETAERCQA